MNNINSFIIKYNNEEEEEYEDEYADIEFDYEEGYNDSNLFEEEEIIQFDLHVGNCFT